MNFFQVAVRSGGNAKVGWLVGRKTKDRVLVLARLHLVLLLASATICTAKAVIVDTGKHSRTGIAKAHWLSLPFHRRYPSVFG